MIGISMRRTRDILRSDKGMASFMVTTVLILVIGLILVGFSQVSRRNQRETLDRQLSTQAFYAAESGVNAAVGVAKKYVERGEIPPTKKDCSQNADYPMELKLSSNVEVTCLLVDTAIDSLYYSGVTERSPTVVPVISESTVIRQITLVWRPAVAGNPSPSQGCDNGNFPTRGGWTCGHGVLRTDVTPMVTGSDSQFAMSTFFRPSTNPNDNRASFGSRGGLVEAMCSDAGGDPKCTAIITGLNSTKYYLNLRSIYKDSTVTITAQDINGEDIELTGQALIDATARAEDVLRRVQVRVPLELSSSNTLPVYAIESTDSICKRFEVFPGSYNNRAAGCN